MRNTKVRNLALAGMFLALAIIFPMLIGRIPTIGRKLLPMHIPVLIAGFVVGPWWGMLVGALAPLLNHAITTMPPLGTAIPMAFELAAYALLAGLLYRILVDKKHGIVLSLIGAMAGGRIVWGIAKLVYSRAIGASFTWQIFFVDAFANAVVGIIVQLILIPAVVFALQKANLLDGMKRNEPARA